MFKRILWAIVLGWTLNARALECSLTPSALPQSPWQNFRIATGQGGEILLMTGKTIPKSVESEIRTSLEDPSMSFRDLANRGSRILSANSDILADHADLLLMLHDMLKRGSLSYVYIDVPYDAVQFEAESKKMYLEAFQMQLRAAPGDVSLDRLILLAVGVPMYIRAVEPNLFKTVDMENLPGPGAPLAPHVDSGAKVSPVPAFKPSRPGQSSNRGVGAGEGEKNADKAWEELERSVRDNRGTLTTIERFRRDIRSGKYDGDSAASVADRAAARVWRQSRRAVRDWVELEMKARRKRGELEDTDLSARRRHRHAHDSERDEDSSRSEGPSSQLAHAVAAKMLARAGQVDGQGHGSRAIGFLRQEWFERLYKEFSAMCEVK